MEDALIDSSAPAALPGLTLRKIPFPMSIIHAPTFTKNENEGTGTGNASNS